MRAALAWSRRALAPGDERVDRAVEVALVHLVEEGEQVVVLALGDERRRRACAGARRKPFVVDVVAPGCARGVAIAAGDVADERVDARSAARRGTCGGCARGAMPRCTRCEMIECAVVGDREDDRARERRRSLRSSDWRAPSWTKSRGDAGGKTRRSCALTRSGIRMAAATCRHGAIRALRRTRPRVREGAPRSDRPSVASTKRIRGRVKTCQGSGFHLISTDSWTRGGPPPRAPSACTLQRIGGRAEISLTRLGSPSR